MIRLGVNIDHVATLRQARRGDEPDPVAAAALCELAGADGITVHVREDRRHIQDRDLRLLRQTVRGTLNLELAPREAGGVMALALEVGPDQVCLVPEHRAELTTEGGLAVSADDAALRAAIDRLRARGCLVSLFIEPDPATVAAAAALGAEAVELHTGTWATAWAACRGRDDDPRLNRERARLRDAAQTAGERGLRLHAGHGINYANVSELLHLPLLRELNIGHSIISRAVLTGMQRAVADMKALLA
jgi:pyridoxine 5-phosphate synthase